MQIHLVFRSGFLTLSLGALAACGALNTAGSAPYTRNTGTVDPSFAAGAGFTGAVDRLLIQSDGKVLAAGRFTKYQGQAVPPLVRLQSDASTDVSFQSALGGGPGDSVYALALKADESILLGGVFTSLDGVAQRGLGQLGADGKVDNSFLEALTTRGFRKGFGAATVSALAVDASGRLIVGGDFTTFDTQSAHTLSRLSSAGALDAAFQANVDAGFDLPVNAVLPRSDGGLLVGGSFTSFRGNHGGGLAKFNADGTLDSAFMVNLGAGLSNGGFDDVVSAVAQTSGGDYLVGGDFSSFRGNGTAPRLARLSGAGVFDDAFAAALGTGFAGGGVKAIVIDSDGNIIVGGDFTSFNGSAARGLVRLTSTGEWDQEFSAGMVTGGVLALALQSDGRLIVAGSFSSFGGFAVGNIVRLK